MSKEEIWSRCERMNAYLKRRCAGLLEIPTRVIKASSTSGDKVFPLQPGWMTHDFKVFYLHRTVRDFLMANKVQKTMLRHLTKLPSGFEPNFCIFVADIMILKRSLFAFGMSVVKKAVRVWDLIDLALHHARAGNGKFSISLTDEIDRIVTY
jgi:hypothetical protein